MDRAGRAVADAIVGLIGPEKLLVLCGCGNNGGDGYVVARELAALGWPVTVARLAPPKSAEAVAAAARYPGPVCTLDDAAPAPILVDALFGTGLERPLDAKLSRPLGELKIGRATGRARVCQYV